MNSNYIKSCTLIKSEYNFQFNDFVSIVLMLNENQDKKKKAVVEQNTNTILEYSNKVTSNAKLVIEIKGTLENQKIFSLKLEYLLDFYKELQLEDTVNREILKEVAPRVTKYIKNVYEQGVIQGIDAPAIDNGSLVSDKK